MLVGYLVAVCQNRSKLCSSVMVDMFSHSSYSVLRIHMVHDTWGWFRHGRCDHTGPAWTVSEGLGQPGPQPVHRTFYVMSPCLASHWSINSGSSSRGAVVMLSINPLQLLQSWANRPFPPTFAIQREREKLRYLVGFFGVLSSPLKTAFGTIGNCRLRSH